MTSQPDKLFRDKLENFQQPAPTGAWDKIEQKLEKPYKIVWLRVAAGIILLSVAAILLWPANKTEHVFTETKGKTPVKNNEAIQKQQPEKNNKATPELEHISPVRTTQTAVVQKTTKQTPVNKVQEEKKDSVSILLPVPQTPELIAEVVKPEVKQIASNTIVYRADEVNSKFLKKKLSPEATPATEEASGIQKLIGLAYTAKNSDTGLGNLRQKKDEILALNFGKNKGEN